MSQPAVLIAFIVLVVAVAMSLRRATLQARFIFNLISFTLASLMLWKSGESPLFLIAPRAIEGSTFWVRLLGVIWWVLAARAAVAALRLVFRRDRRTRQTRLFSDLMAAGIYATSGFAVFNCVLDLPVKGLLATSGVIAIVLGLALQSTLADVFAGIAVGVEGPFRVGDRIRLGDRFEGDVVQINWRSIRIETDDADVVVVPNSQVAKAEIINRSSPSRRRTDKIKILGPAHAAPEMVIELLDRAVMLCPAILAAPAASIALVGLGARANQYSVSYSVADTTLLSSTRSLLLRNVRRAFHHAGLLLPVGDLAPTNKTTDGVLGAEQIFGEMVLFEGLSDAERSALARHVGRIVLEPGDTLFAQGQMEAKLYIIASGVLVVSRVESGATEDIGRVGPGEYLGEISLLTGTPFRATATALTHGLVYQLSGQAIASIMTANPDVAAALDRSVRRGLEVLDREVATCASDDVGPRGQLLAAMRRFFQGGGPRRPKQGPTGAR